MENESFPQNGDTYYWISSNTGEICRSSWAGRNPYCQFRLSTGNVFGSWESAQAALISWQHQVEDKRRALQ